MSNLPARRLGRTGIFAKHEKDVAEVEPHRSQLYLHLAGSERVHKRWLLAQHHTWHCGHITTTHNHAARTNAVRCMKTATLAGSDSKRT